MSCGIPTALEIRHFLEGFCLETKDITNFTVTFASGATTINMGSDITTLRENMIVSGDGIETGTLITGIDYNNQIITIDNATTSEQTDVAISVTKNTFLTDDWLINRRDNLVIPWIMKRTSLNIKGSRSITEYVSGNGLTSLILSNKPILSLQELSYVNVPTDYDSNLQESVQLDSEQGILIAKNNVYDATSPSVFLRGFKNIKVTYTIGYEDFCDEAPDVKEAIINWVASLALQLIGSRNGGGNISQSGFNQNFGKRGKYTEAIEMCETNCMAILSNYFNYTGAP